MECQNLKSKNNNNSNDEMQSFLFHVSKYFIPKGKKIIVLY